MRTKHSPNLIEIGLFLVSFISFQYAIKFLLFFSDLKFYNFILFVHTYNNLDIEKHKKILMDYPIIMYQLTIIGFSLSFLFLGFPYIFYKKAKKILYDFVILFFIVAIFWYFDILRFTGLEFYGLIPVSLLQNLKLYLLVNGGVYFLLAFGLCIFIHWRSKKRRQ